jgi:dTDP-D-glucose 4,6-dehydratase
VAKMGYDIVEIAVEDKDLIDWKSLKKIADDLGLSITISGAFGEARDLSSENIAYRKNSFNYIVDCIQIAEKIMLNFKKINLSQNIKSKIYFIKDRPGHDLRYCLDSSKIKNELKWKCKSSFDQRLNETITWYINKFKDNYFKNKDFKYRIGLKI